MTEYIFDSWAVLDFFASGGIHKFALVLRLFYSCSYHRIHSQQLNLLICVCFQSHLMKDESHWNPSAYPTLFITLHIKTSMHRAPSFFLAGSFPYVWWYSSPRLSRSSSSLREPFLSTLFPNTTNGTFWSSGIANSESSSDLASFRRSVSAASTIKIIPSTVPQ